MNPTKTMIIFSVLFTLSSNAVFFRREKSILYFIIGRIILFSFFIFAIVLKSLNIYFSYSFFNNKNKYNELLNKKNTLILFICQLKAYFDPVIALSLVITLFSSFKVPQAHPFVSFPLESDLFKFIVTRQISTSAKLKSSEEEQDQDQNKNQYQDKDLDQSQNQEHVSPSPTPSTPENEWDESVAKVSDTITKEQFWEVFDEEADGDRSRRKATETLENQMREIKTSHFRTTKNHDNAGTPSDDPNRIRDEKMHKDSWDNLVEVGKEKNLLKNNVDFSLDVGMQAAHVSIKEDQRVMDNKVEDWLQSQQDIEPMDYFDPNL